MTTSPEEKALHADAYEVNKNAEIWMRRIRQLPYNAAWLKPECVNQVKADVENGLRCYVLYHLPWRLFCSHHLEKPGSNG